MSIDIKACTTGCPIAITEGVTEVKKIDGISERGACQMLYEMIIKEKPMLTELYSVKTIRNTYRYHTGKDKVAEFQPRPWTGQYESYTPEKYIKSARVVMGNIDLDPASCEMANKTIQADRYFDLDSNGLKQRWSGKVFLNPPYKQPEVENFITKLITEYNAENVTEAILLTNNSTDTNWFKIASELSIICFTDHRIKFELEDGSTTGPTTGQAFYYFGHHKQKFIDEFRNHGLIFERK